MWEGLLINHLAQWAKHFHAGKHNGGLSNKDAHSTVSPARRQRRFKIARDFTCLEHGTTVRSVVPQSKEVPCTRQEAFYAQQQYEYSRKQHGSL